MATVKQYVDALTVKQDYLCANHLGIDISRAGSTELRTVNLLLKVWLGGVMKALVDKGLLTDAEISDAIDSTLTDGWSPVPLQPPT